MMKLVTAAAALFMAASLKAAEHPKEHPTTPAQTQAQPATPGADAGSKEHPKGHEHPVGSKPWIKQMNKEYVRTVEDYVQKAQASGGFTVHDDKLGKDWALALVRVHKDRIAYLGNNTFFACADFKSTAKGNKSKVDLDFYAVKAGDAWKVDKILVHKVNGRARYTYNAKNEMVPVND